MRRGLLAAALLVGLTACGGGADESDGAAETATVTRTTTTTTAAPPSSATASSSPAVSSTPELSPEMREKIFVTFLEGQGFIPTYASAANAVKLAEALCKRYDAGASYEDVVGVLLDGGVPATDAGGFEGAAVTAYCPEHTSKRTG